MRCQATVLGLDERRARLLDLYRMHPGATHRELAAAYETMFGSRITRQAVGAVLRRAGVSASAEKHHEVRERPARLAELCAQHPRATRDQLLVAYRERYGVALSLDVLYKTLEKHGIAVPKSSRKHDPAEVQLRPQRLFELYEDHPQWTYDQLGREYRERYGIRLGSTLVGTALNSLELYRHRVADSAELSERPQRLQDLSANYPNAELRELTDRYNQLYATSLSESTVGQALTSLGIYRQFPPDLELIQERQARLKELHALEPTLGAEALAAAYQAKYGLPIEVDIVRRTFAALGVALPGQRRSRDPEELQARPARLQALARSLPHHSYTKLEAEYQKRYGVALGRNTVRKVLTSADSALRSEHNAKREAKFTERRARLYALYQENPKMTLRQVAREYARRYGEEVKSLVVSRDLKFFGVRLVRIVDKEELRRRPERLQFMKQEHPEWNHRQLAEEYQRQHGLWLSHALVSHALGRSGTAKRQST